MPSTPHPTKRAPRSRPDKPHTLPLVPEKRDSVTQQLHPALTLIHASPRLFSRQGSVVPTWKTRAAKKHGPYYRLVFRRDGRQHTVYLGRPGELVDRVRAALAELQEPLRRKRFSAHLQKQIRDSLRREKAKLNALLAPHGLHLKGFELRGPRGAFERALTYYVPTKEKRRNGDQRAGRNE